MASGAVLVRTNCLGSVSPLTTGGSCYRWSQKNCAKNCQLKKLRRETMPIFRVKAAFNALIKQTPGEIFNRPKDFVAFTLATGRHLRLLATARPRITQGAPLGKAGFVFKQDQPFAPLGRPDNRWPLVLQP